ncbi:MAG TPA: 3-methyl-2-oxobutanoate dehydrogenase subunit beta, partial [Thermoprotei archaeon]|nr:3-methyl-2-oxobutanoate dehydrogenase subunit beta [Thermoprotei archaeon]
MSNLIKLIGEKEFLLPGNPSCPGCGLALGLRYALKALGRDVIMIVPASCTSIVLGPVPTSSVKIPVLNIAFAAAAATASGMSEALEILGKEDVTIVVWAGDGGTVDIGFQGLSGAAERNNNFIYICYDNEAYMNTGIQRSGSTPKGAWTTTTPKGKKRSKKNVPFIMIEHRIPYVATASIAYPQDFITKLKTAKEIRGLKYIHLHTPCPPGWRFPSNKTIEVARLAVLTGAWILFEVKKGVFKLTGPSRRLLDRKNRKNVEEYLRIQGRFKLLDKEAIK